MTEYNKMPTTTQQQILNKAKLSSRYDKLNIALAKLNPAIKSTVDVLGAANINFRQCFMNLDTCYSNAKAKWG